MPSKLKLRPYQSDNTNLILENINKALDYIETKFKYKK